MVLQKELNWWPTYTTEQLAYYKCCAEGVNVTIAQRTLPVFKRLQRVYHMAKQTWDLRIRHGDM